MLTDEQITAMPDSERRALVSRLLRADPGLPLQELVTRIRRARIGLMVGASAALIPWIGYLAVTLPDYYIAHNWRPTWVGFDVMLMLMMALTALLGWLRRTIVVLLAFSSGILLCCDAWFDIMTAAPEDRWGAVAAAVLVELPLAFLLLAGALRLIRVLATHYGELTAGQRIWQVRLPV